MGSANYNVVRVLLSEICVDACMGDPTTCLTSGASDGALLQKSTLQPMLWAASERLSRTRVLRSGAGGTALSRARVDESDASAALTGTFREEQELEVAFARRPGASHSS
jgi:hypothetical protein